MTKEDIRQGIQTTHEPQDTYLMDREYIVNFISSETKIIWSCTQDRTETSGEKDI